MSSKAKDTDSLDHFKRDFPRRFFVRLHMTLLLAIVCASGLIASKLLLELGLHSMLVRYLIAVCLSYLVFFLLIRIWLFYIGVRRKEGPRSNVDVGDAIDLGQLPGDLMPDSVGIGGSSDGGFGSSGGDFGGGGATDIWGETPSAPVPGYSSSSIGGGSPSGSSGGWGGFDFDFDDDGVILIALLLLLAVIFGAAGYLVYAAPEILSEAAFEALLAAGLIKASRKITRQGWIGSVFKATCLPFIIVLLITGVFGWIVQRHSPEATRLSDVFRHSGTERR